MSNALAVANDKDPGTRVTKRKKRQLRDSMNGASSSMTGSLDS
jgi:hypothetical protein